MTSFVNAFVDTLHYISGFALSSANYRSSFAEDRIEKIRPCLQFQGNIQKKEYPTECHTDDRDVFLHTCEYKNIEDGDDTAESDAVLGKVL